MPEDFLSDAASDVSVVIPAYNCAGSVRRAVESCLEQSAPPREVIVVDDGSTDGTFDVLSGFGAAIKVVRQANLGLAAARNAGFRLASGAFFALMDADDVSHRDRFLLQRSVLKQQAPVVAVHTEFSAFGQGLTETDAPYSASYYPVLHGQSAAHLYRSPARRDTLQTADASASVWSGPVTVQLIHGNFVHPPTVMMRREVFDRLGGFNTSLRSGSDYDFLLRASRLGDFAYIDHPLLRYRLSAAQMSSSFVRGETMLENAAILRSFRNAEPGFYAQHRAVIDRRYAESLLQGAAAQGEFDRRAALGNWTFSLPHGAPVLASKTLLRLLAPRWAFAFARQTRALIRRRGAQ